MLEQNEFTSFCEMHRKSYLALPPWSITPLSKKSAPLVQNLDLPQYRLIGPQRFWLHIPCNPTVLVPQWRTLGLLMLVTSSRPLMFNQNHIVSYQPHCKNEMLNFIPDQICWLKDHESQFHGYHTLFNVLARFQGGRFLKHPVYSDCPDSFCSPNGIASPGHISAWCTAKTADPILQNDQECFIMDGQYWGRIQTVVKCNTKTILWSWNSFPLCRLQLP